MLLNFSDHETEIHLASLSLALPNAMRGDVWAVPSEKGSPQPPLLSGNVFQLEREAGTGQLPQPGGIDGCRMLHLNEKQPMEGAGAVCSSSFHLWSC